MMNGLEQRLYIKQYISYTRYYNVFFSIPLHIILLLIMDIDTYRSLIPTGHRAAGNSSILM